MRVDLVLDGMRDLKNQVIRLESRIELARRLDQRYIPRAEYEARHSDVRNLITKAEAPRRRRRRSGRCSRTS